MAVDLMLGDALRRWISLGVRVCGVYLVAV